MSGYGGYDDSRVVTGVVRDAELERKRAGVSVSAQ